MEIRKDFYPKAQLRDFLRKKTGIYINQKPRSVKKYILNILFFIAFGIYLGWDSYQKGDYITMGVTSILPLSFLIMSHLAQKRREIYEGIGEFIILKEDIITERNKLEDYIKDDIENIGINTSLVEDIKHCISSILKGYRLISKSHKYIQNNTWYLSLSQEQEGQEFINNVLVIELKWIIHYSQEFTLLVQSWISHHATELAELEKQIQSQELTTESDGGKTALELSRISLHEHLKELEKVRV